jgi:hypothetical protein
MGYHNRIHSMTSVRFVAVGIVPSNQKSKENFFPFMNERLDISFHSFSISSLFVLKEIFHPKPPSNPPHPNSSQSAHAAA